MKIDSYDGSSSVENFLIKFNIVSQYNEWTDREKALILQCSLEKDALQILSEHGAREDISFEELVHKLKQRFGTPGKAAIHRSELHCRRQKNNESLRELMFDLKRLMNLAYAEINGEAAEIIPCDSFVNALTDRTLAQKLREKDVGTIDEAYLQAIKLEAFQKLREAEEDEYRHKPHRRFVRGTREDDENDPVMRKLDKVLKTQEENYLSWANGIKGRLRNLESTPQSTPVENHHPQDVLNAQKPDTR